MKTDGEDIDMCLQIAEGSGLKTLHEYVVELACLASPLG